MSTATNGRVQECGARERSERIDHHRPPRSLRVARYLGWKNGLERLAAAALLVPGIPAIGVLIAIVRSTSRGPGIYRQRRVGKDGKPFTMYKIRTMRSDAETKSGAQWCCGTSDPRVTRIGKFIRKLHLDEFPQLFNVLRGEMSLIGPRPERPEFVGVLQEVVADYDLRHLVRPGITGLAQVNLPPDTDIDSVRRKLVLDLDYLEQASVVLDIRVFLCTCLRVFGFSGETAMAIMRLRRPVNLPEDDTQTSEFRRAELTPAAVTDRVFSDGDSDASSANGNGLCSGNPVVAEMSGRTAK